MASTAALTPRALRPATPSRPGSTTPRLRPHTAKPLSSARSPAATPPASSSSAGSDPPPPPMTVEQACDTLGVTELTPFDEVVAAKAAKLGGATGEEADKITAAYDALLMRSMARRLSGAAPIDPAVRFADVARNRSSGRGGGGGGGAGGASTTTRRRGSSSSAPSSTQLAGGLVTLSPARPADRGRQAAVFGGLALWAAVQASTEPAIFAATDTAGLQTAAAAAAAIYFLRDGKGVPLGRAAALALAGLVSGALLGYGLQAVLPPGALASWGGIWACPGVLTAEAGMLGLYGVAALLA